jgi:hypothetical protein
MKTEENTESNAPTAGNGADANSDPAAIHESTNPSIQGAANPPIQLQAAAVVDSAPALIHESNIPLIPREARRGRGKIARLPKAVRDQLNQMILDGLPYAEIPARLGDIAKDINQDNLSTWKTGGHQEWLKEQQRVEDCRISQELTLDLAMERQGIESFQAPNKIAAALICEALADLGSETFRKAIAANPLNALRMLNTLSRLTVGGLKCERHLADEAERKAKLDHSRSPNKKKGGIPTRSRKEVEQEFGLR